MQLDHLSKFVIESFLGKSILVNSELNKVFSTCLGAKQTRNIFPSTQTNTLENFNLIHCDLWDSYNTPSTCGSFYFLTIVDDYSRSVWIYLITEKNEVALILKNFVTMFWTQFH